MLSWAMKVLEAEDRRPEVEVRLEGAADLSSVPELHAHLAEVLALLARERFALVRFDLRELAFLNSSSVKELITFVDAVRELRGGACRVQFDGDKRHAWQRRTLRVLHIIEPDLVSFDLG